MSDSPPSKSESDRAATSPQGSPFESAPDPPAPSPSRRAGATETLHRAARGPEPQRRQAVDELLPLVYDELRVVARRMLANERPSHTLQTTALVHEAYVRLIDQRNVNPSDRAHFFAVAATVIRRILVDHARQRNASKRGGASGGARLTISDVEVDEAAVPSASDRAIDLVALDDALKELAALDERAAQVVTMRYFAGLTMDEIAEALSISPRTVADDWAMARAWLKRELGDTPGRGKGPHGGAR